MEEKEKKEIIKKLVMETLTDSANMICLLVRFGKTAASRIDHGQLHIDPDDREPSGWNQALLKLFPLRFPVAMTTWKGCISVSFMEEVHYFGEAGTREVLEYVLERWGNESGIKKAIENYKIY